jgi:hypothetical protein
VASVLFQMLSPEFEDINRCSTCQLVWKGNRKLCGRCQSEVYCSKTCQELSWKEHKKTCVNKKGWRGQSKNASLIAVLFDLDVLLANDTVPPPDRAHLEEFKSRVVTLNKGRTPLHIGRLTGLEQWRQEYRLSGDCNLYVLDAYLTISTKIVTLHHHTYMDLMRGVDLNTDNATAAVTWVTDVVLLHTMCQGVQIPTMCTGNNEVSDPFAGISFYMGGLQYVGRGNVWFRRFLMREVEGHSDTIHNIDSISAHVFTMSASASFHWFRYDDITNEYQSFNSLDMLANSLRQSGVVG